MAPQSLRQFTATLWCTGSLVDPQPWRMGPGSNSNNVNSNSNDNNNDDYIIIIIIIISGINNSKQLTYVSKLDIRGSSRGPGKHSA